MIRVQVDGRPAPKGSRMQGRTKLGKSYTYPASKYEAPWVKAVAEATRQTMRHRPPPLPPYSVDLLFLISKAHDAKRAGPWPKRHDLDKLARAVIDGLTKGGAMEDDRHVVELHARKRWVQDAEVQGVVACVYPAAELEYAAA